MQQMPEQAGLSHPDLVAGQKVLETEARALSALADSLDHLFVSAVDVMASAEGRVVTTGMGKSGHVARKVAATMASTGTPSTYVHPGEASHGDLGMITKADVVVAFSNSGETTELNDIVAYTRRFQIPLIGVVGRDRSSLGENSDIALVLPDCPEACPMGLAPTTSTTMALALGDALAVALLKRADFSSTDFQDLHPGGTLGTRLVTVTDVMHGGADLPLVAPHAPMTEVLIEMSAKSFGCVGVVDDRNRLMGIITDGDLRRHMGDGLLARPASEIMTPDPKTIRPRALAAEALWLMNTRKITSLFVADNAEPVGILHVHDCLRAGVV